jgi:hypothetical protein
VPPNFKGINLPFSTATLSVSSEVYNHLSAGDTVPVLVSSRDVGCIQYGASPKWPQGSLIAVICLAFGGVAALLMSVVSLRRKSPVN